MASIELTPRDAPAGLGYVAAFSGDQDIVAFAATRPRSSIWRTTGSVGNGAVFVPADRVDGGKLTPRDPIVQSTVVVFSRGGGIVHARRYVADVRDRQLTGTTDGAPPRSATRHTASTARTPTARTVTVFAWRRGNLVLVVLGTSFPPADTLRLATLIDARGDGRAGGSMTRYTYGDSDVAADRPRLVAAMFEPTTSSFLRAVVRRPPALALDLGAGRGYDAAAPRGDP